MTKRLDSAAQSRRRVLYFSPDRSIPRPLSEIVDVAAGDTFGRHHTVEAVEAALDRGIAELLVIDADSAFDEGVALCSRLKADPFDSVIPIVFFSREHRISEIEAAFECGADEFLSGSHSEREQALRLRMVLQRTARDVSVNPTTMLPGTRIIQHDIERRMASGELFAVCYADIDSFKEFNDKYSYHRGDRVIWIVSMILRDVVRRLSERGFVGHVGGDDFIYTLPVEDLERVNDAILETFDMLMPLQYDAAARQRGSFYAEDRRGEVREIPLMTLSIGCITNVRREFTHPGRVSEIASEMKKYAKSKPGSLWVVDRRSDAPAEEAASRGGASDADSLS